MASNSHLSRLSVTPTKAHAQEVIVDSFSRGCRWLNTVSELLDDKETVTIIFDASLFYYNKDRKIEIYKNDLKEFLKGGERKESELSTPILQIFIRSLSFKILT